MDSEYYQRAWRKKRPRKGNRGPLKPLAAAAERKRRRELQEAELCLPVVGTSLTEDSSQGLFWPTNALSLSSASHQKFAYQPHWSSCTLLFLLQLLLLKASDSRKYLVNELRLHKCRNPTSRIRGRLFALWLFWFLVTPNLCSSRQIFKSSVMQVWLSEGVLRWH